MKDEIEQLFGSTSEALAIMSEAIANLFGGLKRK